MSKRGMDFLELWMERNMAGVGDADALTGGISKQEIEEEAGHPIEAFIAAALAHPADGGLPA